MLKVRVMGDPSEVQRFVRDIEQRERVVYQSDPYPCRNKKDRRVYLEVERK